MGIIEIIALINSLVAAASKITARLTETVELFRKMNAEGRTTLTDEEVAQMVGIRDSARKALADEIAKPTGLEASNKA